MLKQESSTFILFLLIFLLHGNLIIISIDKKINHIENIFVLQLI